MAKVLTFSTRFPKRMFPYVFPKPTFFIEKYWNSVPADNKPIQYLECGVIAKYHPHDDKLRPLNFHLHPDVFWLFFDRMVFDRWEYSTLLRPKLHTIRSGKRWKVGEFFSPRVWSEIPYNSKQIIIGEDREIKKIWDIEIDNKGAILISGRKNPFIIYKDSGSIFGLHNLHLLARNDGLSVEEFIYWFELDRKKPFSGQIICWDENLYY